MWDNTVESMNLSMRVDSLNCIPDYELPEQYGWRFYRPGDDLEWARIWTSAGAFDCLEAGLKNFHADFPDKSILADRMIFLTDNGKPFATATAWFDDDPEGPTGRLHWVGIDEEHQGKGLARVLISLTMKQIKALGHEMSNLGTQTHCWVAIGVYNKRFGFYPVVNSEKELRGWKIVSKQSGVDYMSQIEEKKENV